MTSFPSLQRELARQVREARLDHAAFEMPLRVCELTTCRATCCHDGVYLDAEERAVIGEVIADHPEQLAAYGWQADAIFQIVDGRWKSVTVASDDHPEDFPAHFPNTRCVFLDGQHRCVLQRLAMDEGRHPWFWKPISCWMHPLILQPGARDERPLLTLATPENDPAAQPGYPGFSAFTPCGAVCSGGPAAKQTLAAELKLLGDIGGRELLSELGNDGSEPRQSISGENAESSKSARVNE